MTLYPQLLFKKVVDSVADFSTTQDDFDMVKVSVLIVHVCTGRVCVHSMCRKCFIGPTGTPSSILTSSASEEPFLEQTS